jgi:hypothetical protein
MTIKYVWHVSCQLHPTLDVHVIKKTEAFNIYRRHARLCLEIDPPKLVEIPFSIG